MSSSGRSTGTVPKVKSRPNVSSRDLEQRRAPISNMPNNLQASTSSPEWQQSTSTQPAPSSSQGRARKPRNTRQPTRDFFDASLVSHDSHERLRPSAADFTHSLQSDLIMDGERSGGYEADPRRGGGEASLSQSLGNNPRRQEQPHNTLLDTKNNISKIPDRNQVLSRLNQIRDYVKQTSALMDSLRGSSDPRHIIQVIKLDHMNVDLRESEGRLVELLTTLNALEGHEVLPDSLVSPQSPPSAAPPRSRDHSTSDSLSQSRSRSTSEEPRSMPTAAQYAKHHELKLKVEESQKKLQALQEHQAALVALQHKAQAQLREAQAQQGALLATAAEDSPSAINGNVENLNGRMQTLQDMFLNRNEVVHLLGEQDEELEAEHSALQERLQELQGRKQAMDRLVRDLHALGESAPSTGHPVDTQPQQNGVDLSQAESSEEERDGEVLSEVSDKMEELSRMKARLAQLQSMVAAVNRGEMPHDSVKAALTTRELASMSDHQIPSNRAQRGEQERGGSITKPDNIVLSSEVAPNYLEAQVLEIQLKTQQLDKAKQRLQQLRDLLGEVGIADEDDGDDPDEREEIAISQQLSLESVQALSRDIRMQTLSLQAEREQLATAQRGSAKSGQQPATTQQQHQQQQQATNQAKNKNRDTSHRRTADTVGPSSRQLALQAELQAKRQELEELMRKDQGQSSSLNQDTCSEAGFSLPETSATWGGSSSSQTALLATVDQEAEAQEQSMACSSDDALDEPLMDGVHGGTQISSSSRHRQQGHLPLPPNMGAPYQQGWHQFRPKYDTVRKDSSADSRATTPRGAVPWLRPGVSPALGPDILGPSYDLPGSVSSSGATPRPPPSETGSTNTQPLSWWPMQVQQQLEATTAMCQAMMQQWQWGQPGPEPWWNLQGPPAPVQQQQQLVATLSQCCHMLWVQHREMAALHATVQALQERVTCAERCGLAAAATPENNQANPSTSHHQPLKVSLSTGIFPTSPSDQAAAGAAAAGVSSAHSLPNLCDGPPSLPHPSSSYMLPPPPPVPSQFAWMTPPHGSRSSAVPTPSTPGMPSLMRHGPPVTLNNQVPPGIRANNYWDNFRSYSRQNLLSASTKTNEGHMHNPSPIADRSHNSLRGAEPQQAAAPSTVNVTQPGFRSRKQKLNTEQRPVTGTSNPGASPSRHTPGPSSHSRQAFSPSTSQPRPSVSTQEQLYAELAALVAQNQSRPDFLPQLFRELQSLSCDSLCQRALQSIREISHTARGDSRNSDHASQMRPRSRESLGSYPGDNKDEASSSHVLGDAGLPPPLLEEAAGSEDSAESQEGAAALPLPGPTPRPPPRTAHSLEPCTSDLQVGALSVGSGHSGQLDVEIQGLLLQLLPFLKAHREDCCSPALLEAVRQRTLALVPPPSAGLNGFIQGQLDALLEDSLLKFQGCWLRDVGEELLTTIAEVLLNELTFFKLLDTVSRPGQPGNQVPDSTSTTHLNEPCQPSGLPDTAPVDEMIEEGGDELGAIGPPPSQRNCWLPARLREGSAAGGWEARQEVASLEAEAMLGCDGDLAEADQSHEDGRIAESNMVVGAPTSTSDSLGDGPISGRNSQAEGIAADDSSSDMAEDEMDNLEDLGAASLADNQVPTEDNGWHVEQDRELDQVPTRLEPGGNVPPQQPAPPTPPPSLRGPSPSSPRP